MTVENLLVQLDQLVSEQNNDDSLNIDLMSSHEIVQLMNQQDALISQAVAKCSQAIAKAVDILCSKLKQGGRLIYLGAGTSGRLGILDAVECPPTFGVDPNPFIGLIAGGESAIFKAVEGAEDNPKLAQQDLSNIHFNSKDVLMGIAASGRTPYVLGGLKYAQSINATTLSLCCNPQSELASVADINICVEVGAEVLTGSTRLKSGTAQKMVLNMISTATMIRMGKAYHNLMVDVSATNEKLKARCLRIVMQACDCNKQIAETALIKTDHQAKLAILHIKTGLELTEANNLLSQYNGFLRAAIDAAKA